MYFEHIMGSLRLFLQAHMDWRCRKKGNQDVNKNKKKHVLCLKSAILAADARTWVHVSLCGVAACFPCVGLF